MNLHNTIVSMIRDFPSLFQSKTDATCHLFQHYGTGYEWHNGELVDIFTDRSVPRPDSEVFDDEEAEVKKYMEEHADDLNNPNLKNYHEDSIITIRLRVRRNNIEAQYARDNCELMARTIHNFKDNSSSYKDVNPFDLCQYSPIYTVPADVKEDWLKAIVDEIYHILHLKVSSYSTSYFEGIHNRMVWDEKDRKKEDPLYVRARPIPTIEEMKLATYKNNREWCIKSVQRINSMFPGTFKFNSNEEYEEIMKVNEKERANLVKELLAKLGKSFD